MPAFDQLMHWPGQPAAGVTDAAATIADAGATTIVQPWASVTKLVTALAVLRLVDLGDIDLDEPAGPPGSSVRHLLAHASGIAFEGSNLLAEPGRRRIYSNAGFDLLGELVIERSHEPFEEHAARAIFTPLQMTSSAITGSAAAGAVGSIDDLLKLGRELLAPTLISHDLLKEATSVAFPGLTGVLPGFGRCDPNDWGLGFEIRDRKDPHWTGQTNSPGAFGHFGQKGSFLWVDPAIGLACAAATGADFGPWAAQAWPPFSDAVVAEFGLSRRPSGLSRRDR